MSIQLVHRFIQLEQRKRRLKRLTDANNAARDEAEKAALEYMASEGADSIKTKLGTVSHRNTLRARLATETRDEAYAIMRKIGLGDMVKPGVNANTLSSYIRENDNQVPEELRDHVVTYDHHQLGFRQSS